MKINTKGNKVWLLGLSLSAVLLIIFLQSGAEKLPAQSLWNKYFGNERFLDRDQFNNKRDGSLSFDFVDKEESWKMHSLDPNPPSGSDGVKFGDINGDGLPDLVTGFEEDGVSRIYIHPGWDKVHQYWDYVELPSPDVEDAVLVDLDNNGSWDLVTASEGATNRLMFHWAPENPNEYLEASKWAHQAVPVTDGLSAWMFVVPVDLDGQAGTDLIVGSKRKRGEQGDDKAVVGWLKSPNNPRSIDDWEYQSLSKAGWIMSINWVDMNEDHHADILISDRKFSSQTGVRWLENPGPEQVGSSGEWKSHLIGVEEGEPMFLTITDLDRDGWNEIVVPDLYSGLRILKQSRNKSQEWIVHSVPYPGWAGSRGKSVSAGDLDLDGRTDLVLSFEEEGKVASLSYEEYKPNGKYSVIWGSFQNDPFSEHWNFQKISGLKGRKFDLVNIIDIDGDGDLDVLTNDENEEGKGMGVVWYENPAK